MKKVAILVDGGFYRARAKHKFGFSKKKPEENASVFEAYCLKHAEAALDEGRELYRIFYYDCPPIAAVVRNPITRQSIDLSKSNTFVSITNFLKCLANQRKVAIRRGKLGVGYAKYTIKPNVQDALLEGRRTFDSLAADDVHLQIDQKGVDMRLGLDLVEMALKRLVDQIVLVSGDSDFIPALKMARREGVDVILDAMGNHVPDDLLEHVDGVRSFFDNPMFVEGYARPISN